MATIRIDPNVTVPAQHTRCWNMSLLGNPRMVIVCGNCTREFTTRRYYPHRGEGGRLTASCTHCGWWNVTPLVQE